MPLGTIQIIAGERQQAMARGPLAALSAISEPRYIFRQEADSRSTSTSERAVRANNANRRRTQE